MENPVDLSELKSRLDMLERRVKVLEAPEWPSYDEAASRFEPLLHALESRDLQTLFRCSDLLSWAEAIVTLPEDLLDKIRGSLSDNAWRDLAGDAKRVRRSRGIILRRQEIMKVMRQLEKMGEIQFGAEGDFTWTRPEPLPYSRPHVFEDPSPDPEVQHWLDFVLKPVEVRPKKRV